MCDWSKIYTSLFYGPVPVRRQIICRLSFQRYFLFEFHIISSGCETYEYIDTFTYTLRGLTLSQTTNFKLFQNESVYRRLF